MSHNHDLVVSYLLFSLRVTIEFSACNFATQADSKIHRCADCVVPDPICSKFHGVACGSVPSGDVLSAFANPLQYFLAAHAVAQHCYNGGNF